MVLLLFRLLGVTLGRVSGLVFTNILGQFLGIGPKGASFKSQSRTFGRWGCCPMVRHKVDRYVVLFLSPFPQILPASSEELLDASEALPGLLEAL